MKRTIKNLFSAPTDSRTGGARLGARMLPAPTHLRRLFVALVALLTMTAQTAWADSWTSAGGTGGSSTNDAPYYVNMPSKGTATNIGSAACADSTLRLSTASDRQCSNKLYPRLFMYI